MSHSPPKYRLRNKISEDSKTKTYLAEDLKLSRIVIFVVLRKRLEDAEVRNFLLHARSLGKLKHPGILPIYDMGMIGRSYFYCFRPPPSTSLQEQLNDQKASNSLFFKSRNFRLQVLMDIAGTLSYAHSQKVSIGRLDFKSIVLGQHGEVILSDWSKSRWFRSTHPEDQEQFELWVQEDLKLLAILGMKFCLLDQAQEDMSISKWDRLAQKLPLDLELIFDRAYLKRPAPYKSVKDFQTDLLCYSEGRPLEFHKGDVLFTIQGFIRRHQAFVKSSFVLSSICGLIFFIFSFMLSKERNILVNHNQHWQQSKQERDQFKLELAERKNLHSELSEEKQSLQKDIDWNQKFISDIKKDQLQKEKEEQKKLEQISKFQQQINGLNKKIKTEEKNIQALKESPERLQSDLQNLKLELARITQQPTPFFLNTFSSPINQATEAQILLENLEPKTGWLYDYLLQKSKSLQLIDRFPLKNAPEKITINKDFNLAAWTSDSELWIADPKQKAISNIKTKLEILNITFSSENHILHGVNQDLQPSHIQMSTSGSKLVSIKSTSFKLEDHEDLFSFSDPKYFYFKKGQNINHLENKNDSKSQTTFSFETNETILRAPSGHFFKRNSESLSPIELPEQNLALNPKDQLGFLHHHLLYQINKETLKIYRVHLIGPKEKSCFQLVAQHEFPTSVISIHSIHPTDKIWIYLRDKSHFQWDLVSLPTPLKMSGKPLIASLPYFMTYYSKKIEVYQMPMPENEELDIRHLFPGSSPKNLIAAATHFDQNDIIDSYKPDYLSNAILILHDPFHPEIWDQQTNQLIGRLGTSSEELTKISYSKKTHRIVTLSKSGKLRFW